MRFARLLLVGGLIVAGVARADDDPRSKVDSLVRQLDSPKLAQRDAAEAALIAQGPGVMPLLPQGEKLSAETRQRLDRIRQRLERAASEAAIEPTTITMHSEATALSKILELVQKHSGNTIVDCRREFGQPLIDPKVTLDLPKTNFWPALDRVLDEAGLTIYPYAKPRAIGFVAAKQGKSAPHGVPPAYVGPLRIQAVSLTAQRDLRGTSGTSLVLALDVAWEPRLTVINLVQPMSDVTAIDDRGNAIAVADRQARSEMPLTGEASAVNIDVPLRLPPREARKIARLKGTLLATIAGKHETFRFSNLLGANDIKRRIAGVTVILERVSKISDGYEVRVRVRFDDAGDALASHRQWIFKNPAYLEGPDGKPIPYSGYDTTAQSKNEIGLAYRFVTDRPLGDLDFVYQTPGMILNRSYGYELRDLDLP